MARSHATLHDCQKRMVEKMMPKRLQVSVTLEKPKTAIDRDGKPVIKRLAFRREVEVVVKQARLH